LRKPWMPFYVGDYLADTSHLTTAEHGAYILLICHYWRNGGLPAKDEQRRRISKMTVEEWAASRDTIAEFFDADWKHKRIEFELTEAARLSAAGKAGGKASGEARRTTVERPLNDQGNDSPTKREALQSQSQSKKEDIRAVANATRPADRFVEFWETYPKRDGANPKEPARRRFAALVKSGVDPGAIIAGAGRYAADMRARAQDRTPYVAQALTWLNQQRWGDYSADPPKLVELTGFYAEFGSEQLDAWDKTKAGGYPRDKAGGWRFPTEWPPGYKQEAA
jgi:uncharacterized protein YdaU (DUF1376 family)